MTKTKRVINVVFVCLLAALFAVIALAGNGIFAKAEEARTALDQATEGITVTAKARANATDLSANEQDSPFDNVKYKGFMWKDIQYFDIAADQEKVTSAGVNANDDGDYDYEIKVQYWQKKPIAGETLNAVTEGTVTSGTTKNLEEIKGQCYVDKTEGKFSLEKGWGIYRFVLTINEHPFSSILYYVEPSKVTMNSDAPEITVENYLPEVSSSMLTAYRFTITNQSDDYKYMDETCIRWFVYGTSRDGTKYCYHVDDIGTNDFPSSEYSTEHTLAKADQSRVVGSKTFQLETGDVAGEWNVYCVIYETTPGRDNIDSLVVAKTTKDQAILVKNGEQISTSSIIWIIVAAAVVLVAGLVIIIVRSVKKEKVW